MNDLELHAGLTSRNPDALVKVIESYAAPVYALISRILHGVGSCTDIEECSGDVFFAAWEQASRYQPERASFRTWLLMIAKYQALEYRRRLLAEQGLIPLEHVNKHGIPSPGPTPEAVALAADERRQILEALAMLSPVDKELVYRRYFLYETVESLASDLGLTHQAVYNRLWRARKALHRFLKAVGFGGGSPEC